MRALLTNLCLILLFSTVGNAKIVFDSKRDGISGIYVMNDDGSNETLLTKKLTSNYPHYPRWSPDGTQIVFEMQANPPENRKFQLFLMNTSGTNVRPLTELHAWIDSEPSFSPDGKQVLFTRDTFKKRCSYILDLESGEIIQLPDIVANSPDWSPDGRQIVFASTSFAIAGAAGGNIWIMDADGENARQLLPTPDVDGRIIDRSSPRWSPDGKQILYAETEYTFEPRGQFEFLILKANRYFICDQNGEEILQLSISKKWKAKDIDWMDNGESVLLSAAELKLNRLMLGNNHHYNIYKYHIATRKTTRLTDHPGNDSRVDWISGHTLSVSPKGKKQTQWGKVKKGSSGPQ
jgi:Tol biopolymer transport system component